MIPEWLIVLVAIGICIAVLLWGIGQTGLF
jgi:hypothetical protein